jgi:hypothetical protein
MNPLNIDYNISEKVTVWGMPATITIMLGKETNDPNELDWYEIKFENGNREHVPVTEITKI